VNRADALTTKELAMSELIVPRPKRRLRGILYAGVLLLGGGVIGAIVAGPVLGQGPGMMGPGMMGEERGYDGPRGPHGRGDMDRGDGPRWRRGWSDADRDDGPRWRRDGDNEQGGPGWRHRGDGPERFGGRSDLGGGPGFGGGHGFGGRMFPGAIERGVGRILGLVDASTEQRQKVRTILESAANDLYPIRQKRMENRRQIAEALAAATIDRAKIETLRTEQVKLADAASKRLTDAMADAAEVLTPAQRAELGRRIGRWRQ
jgi:Spy/CpxP family protein refolding chaperone